MCSLDSAPDESGSIVQKTLSNDSLEQEHRSVDHQNSCTDTGDLCETLQRCFDDSPAKYTGMMMTVTEECPTKIDAVFTHVGRELDASIDVTPFRKRNSHLDSSQRQQHRIPETTSLSAA